MPDDQPYYMDISHHPLAEATIDDIGRLSVPQGRRSRAASPGCAQRALRLGNETPYAVVSGISGVVYEICWYLRGLEQWFMDMLTQPEFCEALLGPHAAVLARLVPPVPRRGGRPGRRDHDRRRPGRPERPAVPARRSTARSSSRGRSGWCSTSARGRKAKIWYHTCGSCVEYIPDLLDNGIDILNPVQISATGMDPAALKARFGDRLVFWGGAIDAQHVLPTASPETVREHVRRNLEVWKPGGGYVFNNVHNIQAGVPPENIVALFDAAYEYGFYP